MVSEGDKAPDFSLTNEEGKMISLKDFLGTPVVLFFYPKDNTPGCTQEVCDFRDNFGRVRAAGAEVFGVSADSVDSHRKFIAKKELPFSLLSDPDHTTLDAYSVWKKKSLYGKVFLGIERSTFIIDRNGMVARVFRKVKVSGHVDAVLDALKTID